MVYNFINVCFSYKDQLETDIWQFIQIFQVREFIQV